MTTTTQKISFLISIILFLFAARPLPAFIIYYLFRTKWANDWGLWWLNLVMGDGRNGMALALMGHWLFLEVPICLTIGFLLFSYATPTEINKN